MEDVPTRTLRRESPRSTVFMKMMETVHQVASQKVKGMDYVVFNCPGCRARNKQAVILAKGVAGEDLAFICNRCCREIEVSKPSHPVPEIIVPGAPAKPSGLVGPTGQPLGG